jgi:hypothetical protein
MSITTSEIYQLNRMNKVANAVQLGTLIAAAEAASGGASALVSGHLFVGNGSGLAADCAVSGDITMANDGAVAIATDAIINADVNPAAAIAWSKMAALTAGYIVIGHSDTVPTARVVSGDITLSSAGVVAIATGVVVNADINASAAIAYSKLAQCDSHYIVAGVSNVATVCSVAGDLTMTAAGTAATFAIATGVIINADVNASAAIAYSKLAVMAANKILAGVSNVATVCAVAGDLTMTAAGTDATFAIASAVIINADINASAAIAWSKMAAVTQHCILAGVAAGGVPTVCAVAGDLTMTAAGTDATFAIASAVIVNADVNASAAIAWSKMAAITSNYILAGVSSVATVCSVAGDISLSAAVTTATFAIGSSKVEQFMFDRVDTYEDFEVNPAMCKAAGLGACTGTAGDVNLLQTDHNCFEWHVKGTQTILAPVFGATGLDIAQDVANAGDGAEYTQGITARSKSAFVVGTDGAFYFKCRVLVHDVTGLAELAIGFRKAEAYQASFDNYDECACINVQAGDVMIETILNNGSTVTTDSTDNLTDDQYIEVTVNVSSAGVVTYLRSLNGGATAAPTVTAAYTFDNGEVVVPFLFFMHAADFADATILQHWEVGLQ